MPSNNAKYSEEMREQTAAGLRRKSDTRNVISYAYRKERISMPSNNAKYSEEMREQTAAYILERGKSAMRVAEEMGIDVNTVCRWVRAYRRKHGFSSYTEENGMKASMSRPGCPYDNSCSESFWTKTET